MGCLDFRKKQAAPRDQEVAGPKGASSRPGGGFCGELIGGRKRARGSAPRWAKASGSRAVGLALGEVED
eukprot:1688138-Alexandrium_andersonii.AAC.1